MNFINKLGILTISDLLGVLGFILGLVLAIFNFYTWKVSRPKIKINIKSIGVGYFRTLKDEEIKGIRINFDDGCKSLPKCILRFPIKFSIKNLGDNPIRINNIYYIWKFPKFEPRFKKNNWDVDYYMGEDILDYDDYLTNERSFKLEGQGKREFKVIIEPSPFIAIRLNQNINHKKYCNEIIFQICVETINNKLIKKSTRLGCDIKYLVDKMNYN